MDATVKPGTNPFGWPRWLWRVAMALVALIFVSGLANNLVGIAFVTGLLPISDIGINYDDAPGRPRWYRVLDVTPGGAASLTGIVRGDLLYFDERLRPQYLPSPGTPVSVVVEHAGRRSHKAIVMAKMNANARNARNTGTVVLAIFVSQLVSVAFGALLLFRGRGSRAAIHLGVLLLLLGLTLLTVPRAPNLTTAAAMAIAYGLADIGFSYFWPMFALEISGGVSDRKQARIVHGFAAAFAIAMAWLEAASLLPDIFPLPIPFSVGNVVMILFNQGFGYGVLLWNYRRNDATSRNRLKIVLFAFVCYMLWGLAGAGPMIAQFWIQIGIGAILSYIAPALLAYAVLKQRLFDLGFVLNRTLVYGTVSFILLAVFGLAEWSADHLIPESWHRESALYSAGIALALFLSFHRLRDWVEKQVERLFFHRWHQAEAGLRRFVGSAGHFEQASALCRGFEEALARFTGVGSTIYLRGSDGAYRLQCTTFSTAPADFGQDNPAFALMRAERSPIELGQADGTIPGALALPMLDQGALSGFVLIGRKSDGTDYRPDEVELLGWAVHQVGLDLQAIHARELEATVRELNNKVAWLTGEKDRLVALLAAPSLQSHG